MGVTLKTGDFNAFFDAPFAAYGANSPYVSPLKGDLKRFLSVQNPLLSGVGGGALNFFTAHRPPRRQNRGAHHRPCPWGIQPAAQFTTGIFRLL